MFQSLTWSGKAALLKFSTRPRILYLLLFTYLASSGGRFSSLLFPTFWPSSVDNPQKLTNMFAFYWLTYSLSTPLTTALTDSFKPPPRTIMVICLIMSISSFTLHFYVTSYASHVFLRFLYAAATGPIMSNLDAEVPFLSGAKPRRFDGGLDRREVREGTPVGCCEVGGDERVLGGGR